MIVHILSNSIISLYVPSYLCTQWYPEIYVLLSCIIFITIILLLFQYHPILTIAQL